VPRTTLLGNLGAHHRAIKTSSAESQQFFDEGLTLLFGFNHEESFNSFARAAALDPTSPMPHWGMSLALGTNINDVAPADRLAQAYAHLSDANARAPGGSDVEQGLVAALGKRYVANPTGDQMSREQAYSDAMGDLMRRFPEDLDVATLYAESLMNLRPWKLYKEDGTPAPATDIIVSTLEGVLARNPQHPGANHYYIHAVEASQRPDRAVQSAERLETLVPGAGHLVHMPAHIYIRTGQYARSAKSNADAAAVDEQYFKATGTSGPYSVMYYGHNLQFESAAAMFAGNFAQARDAARRTVTLVDPVADGMLMVEPFAAMELLVQVRFGRWDEVLTAKAPSPTRTMQTALHHFARGAALAATGRHAEAASALEALRDAVQKIPADGMVGPANSAASVAAVAVADLTGRVAESRGDLAAAIAGFTAAVAAEDQLGYNEPPDWLLPEREMLGRVLVRAGKPAEAEKVFRVDLTKNVGNPRALFGLWRSLEAQKKPAADAKAQFEQAWSSADGTLSLDDWARRP
jgi:tetratricopeptide (TPR) repeat protein